VTNSTSELEGMAVERGKALVMRAQIEKGVDLRSKWSWGT
jgi:hypothetical protein